MVHMLLGRDHNKTVSQLGIRSMLYRIWVLAWVCRRVLVHTPTYSVVCKENRGAGETFVHVSSCHFIPWSHISESDLLEHIYMCIHDSSDPWSQEEEGLNSCFQCVHAFMHIYEMSLHQLAVADDNDNTWTGFLHCTALHLCMSCKAPRFFFSFLSGWRLKNALGGWQMAMLMQPLDRALANQDKFVSSDRYLVEVIQRYIHT